MGTSEGVTQSDRAGNSFAERLRAAATGLYAAAERMGERLRGIAEDVFAYTTGQRDAERAGHAVESAGAALERADRTLEPVIQRELEIREERLIQEREHVLSLNGSVSRKYRNARWMALRWDGETMKNGSFSGLSGGMWPVPSGCIGIHTVKIYQARSRHFFGWFVAIFTCLLP